MVTWLSALVESSVWAARYAAAPLGWGWKQGKNFRNCQGNSLRNRHLRPYPQRGDLSEEEWYSQVLFPFMDDVPLILTGGDFANDYCIISRGPMLATFSWRWWGGIVADWANRSLSPCDPPYKWDYLDFYMDHGTPLFPNYGEWAKVLRRGLNSATNEIQEQ